MDAFTDRRFEPFDRSVDVLVSKLRRKIEPDPKEPRLIVTVPGEGYRFDALLRGAAANSATAFDTQASAEPVGMALMDPRSAKAPEGSLLTNGALRPFWPRTSPDTRASWGVTKQRRCGN